MRGVAFAEHGGPDRLRLQELPEPQLKPGDALIAVGATSINGFDPQILAGTTGLRTPLPMVPCGDFAGTVLGFGPDTDPGEWKAGDRVCPFPFVLGEGMTGETRTGAACERVRIPLGNLIRTPDGVTDVQAASLPIAYGTARRIVHERGAIREGERVLILGATGGVGVASLQLAKRQGAVVIAAGSAEWKLEKLRALGADHTIDTSKEDFVQVVHERFGKPHMVRGGGVEVVINYIGGDTWGPAQRCLAPRGRMLTCGATAGFDVATDLRFLWTYEQSLLGSNGWTPADQRALLDDVAAGRLEPVVHGVRPLAEVADAIRELRDRRVVGKILIEVGAAG